jgi:hypothetical protein
MTRGKRAFTLLELLASVTLLVILGALLFEVFSKSSEVVRVTSARQEIFQYARAALEFLDREVTGSFTSCDADTANGIKGFRVYAAAGNNSLGVAKRAQSEAMFYSTGLIARDMRPYVPVGSNTPNPFFGHDVNVARVAYYLNSEIVDLSKASLMRAEKYDLTIGALDSSDPGDEFVMNCMDFRIQVLSQYVTPVDFSYTDWNSDDTITTGGHTRRMGLPRGVRVSFKMTDDRHAKLYQWNGSKNVWELKAGYDPASSDPVVQSFTQAINLGRRSD